MEYSCSFYADDSKISRQNCWKKREKKAFRKTNCLGVESLVLTASSTVHAILSELNVAKKNFKNKQISNTTQICLFRLLR